jgi:hypothetical protein
MRMERNGKKSESGRQEGGNPSFSAWPKTVIDVHEYILWHFLQEQLSSPILLLNALRWRRLPLAFTWQIKRVWRKNYNNPCLKFYLDLYEFSM